MNEPDFGRRAASRDYFKGTPTRAALEQGAAKLRAMKDEITETFASRGRSGEDWKAWEAACARFHGAYDSLAFPGGLDRAFRLLEAGDLAMAETAILYCEIRPYYFRSGYHRDKLVRLLKKLSLPRQLAIRLDQVNQEIQRRKIINRQKRTGEIEG